MRPHLYSVAGYQGPALAVDALHVPYSNAAAELGAGPVLACRFYRMGSGRGWPRHKSSTS